MLLKVYIASVILSIISCILYIAKFNRIVEVYKVTENGETPSIGLLGCIIYILLSFIPIYNLALGYMGLEYGAFSTDLDFIKNVFNYDGKVE